MLASLNIVKYQVMRESLTFDKTKFSVGLAMTSHENRNINLRTCRYSGRNKTERNTDFGGIGNNNAMVDQAHP